MKHIGIVGGGNMGAAIIGSIFKKYKVVVCEQDKKRAQMLRRKFSVAVQDLPSLVQQSDIILVAVKPQDIEDVLAAISLHLTNKKFVISIAAGITTSYMEKKLGNKSRVIRTMPNMPAQIGEGITAACRGAHATQVDLLLTCKILNAVGKTVVVKEDLIDAITAVSGSGPAYVFFFVECFLRAAENLGLDKKLSSELVKSTLLGSAHLLYQQQDDAAALRAKVTSKGGTTQAALEVLLKNRFEEIFLEALAAAKRRAGELAR